MSIYIRRQRSEQIAIRTLDRPQRHNALIPELLSELLEALTELGREQDVRAVILRANGPSFSTGGDLRGFYEHLDAIAEYSQALVGLLNEVILAMMRFPRPLIAAVQGMVTGGALGLVLAADVVLVTPEASFTPYYSVVGFSPDGGWTALLPEIIGVQRTARILFENQTITAAEAVAWGLASSLVPAAMLEQRAQEVARMIAAHKTGGIARAKRLLRSDLEGVAARLEEERRQFVAQIRTPEAQEGMLSFLQQL